MTIRRPLPRLDPQTAKDLARRFGWDKDVRPGDDILYVSDVCIVLAGEPELKPCPVCKGECQWCNTPGILKCGDCYPDDWR